MHDRSRSFSPAGMRAAGFSIRAALSRARHPVGPARRKRRRFARLRDGDRAAYSTRSSSISFIKSPAGRVGVRFIPLSSKLLCTGIDEIRQTACPAGSDEVTLATARGLSIGDAARFVRDCDAGICARLAEVQSGIRRAMRRRPRRSRKIFWRPWPGQRSMSRPYCRERACEWAILSRCGRARSFCWGRRRGSAFDCLVNGKAQFKGEMVATGTHQGFQIE